MVTNKIPSPLLIIYPYFYPAQKAGGIVTSIENLIHLLAPHPIIVFTSCYDLDGTLLADVVVNSWCNYSSNCKVFYATKNFVPNYKKIVTELGINTVYINGIFGYRFVVKPILELKNCDGLKIVVAPRGMLQPNSLRIKSLKKSLYFGLLMKFNLFKNVAFHAINGEEYAVIEQFMGSKNITIAPDTTRNLINDVDKKTVDFNGPIRLIFLSLLTEKKNLNFLLQLMNHLPSDNFTLDIFGPIVDGEYWRKSLALIDGLPNVQYRGSVNPDCVCDLIAQYHYFVLPTLDEVFGHVIFESMTSGTPILISDKTPWKDIQNCKVGWALPLEDGLWIEQLKNLRSIGKSEYESMSTNCHKYIDNYLANSSSINDYKQLFSI